jgi:hypothetical protein
MSESRYSTLGVSSITTLTSADRRNLQYLAYFDEPNEYVEICLAYTRIEKTASLFVLPISISLRHSSR